MTSFVYVDNSNLFIEGCRISAVKKALAKDIYEAMNMFVVDHTWQVDYGKLYTFLCGQDAVARLWGSPPPGDSFWNMLEKKGFNPTVYEKNFSNKEKKVDVAIAHRMTKDAYTLIDKTKDEIILVAGDSDYVPVVTDLKSEGFRVEVAFWNHAARELKDAVKDADKSNFISFDQYHAHFTR
ncbi:NYN domain-containing protein [Rhizobium leguminosarum]|uniref:NYN domain-containing protein n=1 Tax=Rhizobium leguminosarum TaxID=384 RepID=UPI001C97AD08|nr:NYN domain-containing protein [Rhizobium leguminosarum]MBY5329596.1 NYN domain-containing protein [Rhizobium leguminosarum]